MDGFTNSTNETSLVLGNDTVPMAVSNSSAYGVGLFANVTAPTSAEAARSLQLMAWTWPLLLLFCFSFCHVKPTPNRRAAVVNEEEQRREELKQDPVRRDRLMESSLITKRVIARDENKNLTLGEPDGSVADDLGGSVATSLEDENESACVVCLEPFRVGDEVTWSKKSTECRHVFHKECLMEWLVNPKHDDCPSCRCRILHTDEFLENENRENNVEEDEEDEEENLQQAQSFAFVIMNGLISPLRHARYSLIGSSIQIGIDDSDSDIEEDDPNRKAFRRRSLPHRLRRVLSAGATDDDRPSRFAVALRRVSSGLYSKLSGSDEDTLIRTPSDDDTNTPVGLNSPMKLKRSLSEGYPTGETVPLSYASNDVVLDSSKNTGLSLFQRISRRRLPSAEAYTKIAASMDSAEIMEEEFESSDEESLEPRTLFVDDDDDEDEEDGLELGVRSSPSTPDEHEVPV